MSFREEILFKIGADASGVERGMSDAERRIKTRINNMVGIRSQAELDYQKVWRAAEMERDKLAEAAHLKNISRWRAELNVQRGNASILQNLKQNVSGRSGGHGGSGGGHGSAGLISEGGVVARELAYGRTTRLPGSISRLLQLSGMLPRVLTAIVNPLTGIIAGLAAGVGIPYAIGRSAANTLRNAGNVGFSAEGYQAVMRQGGEAAGGGVGHLNDLVGRERSGDEGAFKTFQRYGVSTTDASGSAKTTEQIYGELLDRLNGTADSAKRAAMATAFFGDNAEKMQKQIAGGSGAFSAVKDRQTSATDLQTLSTIADSLGGAASATGSGISKASGTLWGAAKGAYAGYGRMVNSAAGSIADKTGINWTLGKLFGSRAEIGGLNQEYQEGFRGMALDTRLSDLKNSADYKKSAGGRAEAAQREKDARAENPELFTAQKTAQEQKRDLEDVIADQNKGSIGDLASEGRRFTGQRHRRSYSLTPRMKTALKVEDLDEQARVAWEKGDDKGMAEFTKQANDLRAASPWLKAGDRNPMRKTEEQLERVNTTVSELAKRVNDVLGGKT